MSKQPERPNNDQPNPTFPVLPAEINIEALPSVNILDSKPSIAIGGDFSPEVVDLPEGGPSVVFANGVISIDKKAFEAEKMRVTNWLRGGVLAGDERVLGVYLRNLPGLDNETQELRDKLERAFREKDLSILGLDTQLDALHVNVPTSGIAERNLIREGLRPELSRQPFSFRDRNGVDLNGEEDLDIVFSRRVRGDEFQIIIGSKKGIDQIVLPQELSGDKFQPDLEKMQKDQAGDTILIPLKAAKDGSRPSASVIEVHKGPIDIVNLLARQEEAEKRQRELEEREEERRRSSYTPPSPRASSSRWSSVSG